MAQLALGVAGAVVGGMFGGPLGASIGWSLGSAAGAALDPQKIQGPRLTDLRLQGSSYGQMCPIVYGSMRVAGNVVWQTDLVEHAKTEGGKGGPEVTTYSYSASFRTRFCEGAVGTITRLWADGRVVFDITPNAELISDVPVTWYLGDDEQTASSTEEAELGAGNAPAYRGRVCALFTDWMLTDFGNRIPSLEAEIVATGERDDAVRRYKYKPDAGPVYKGGYFPETLPACAIMSWTGDDIAVAEIESSGSTVDFIEGDYSGQIKLNHYDPSTLTFTTQDTVGPGLPIPRNFQQRSVFYPSIRSYQYRPCGLYGPSKTPIWVYRGPHGTGIGNQGSEDDPPAMAAGSVWMQLSDAGDYPMTSNNILLGSGIPSGRYVGGVAFSANKRRMYVFTAPTPTEGGATVIDRWDMLEDGVVTDTGTVSPLLDNTKIGFGYTGMTGYMVSAFEDNGTYMWNVSGANPVGTVTTYKIDPATKNFAINSTSGVCNWGDGAGEEVKMFHLPSIQPLGTGYCGMVAANSVIILTRFAVGTSEYPTLDEVVSDLCVRGGFDPSEIDVTDLANDVVPGYIVNSQMPVRSALEPLMAAYFFDAVESDGIVKFVKRGATSVVAIPDADLAAQADGGGSEIPALMTTTRGVEEELPATVYVKYYNLDSDYQAGTQVAQRQTTSSQQSSTIDLPIAMTDSRAKQTAEALLYDAWLARERFSFVTGRKYAYLEPTDVVTVRGRVLRITRKEERADKTIAWEAILSFAPVLAQPGIAAAASGTPTQTVRSDQSTQLELMDIPLVDDADQPGYYAALAGTASRWPGAALFRSTDDGTSYTNIQSVLSAATMGTATTALADYAGGNSVDELSTVTVVIGDGGGSLSSTTQVGLLNGANLCRIGREVLQFRAATLTAPGTYQLSGFLRGRRGTEWATASHAAGERFVLMPVNSLAMSSSEIGLDRLYKPVTNGSTLANVAPIRFASYGEAWKPYAPCHLGGGSDSTGNTTLQWKRRGRIGGAWLNYSDVPLGESTEAYVVQVWDSTYTDVARILTATSESVVYTAAMQVADFGAEQKFVWFTVGQMGSFGLGRQAAGYAAGVGGSDGSVIAPIAAYGSSPPVVVSDPTPAQSDTVVSGTRLLGYVDAGMVWRIKFTTPSLSYRSGHLVVAEYDGPPVMRNATLSATPGGQPIGSTVSGTSVTVLFFVKDNPFPTMYPTLAPSTDYWLTVSTSSNAPSYCDYIISSS